MCDIFLTEDVRQLFRGKHVVFMGDSNIRALYKDLVCLSEQAKFITVTNLKAKLPNSVYGDKLVFSGPLCNGRNYREEREKHLSGNTNFSFFFLTRVFDDYVETVLQYITSAPDKPDVVIVNSCLWDISRWGPNGIKMYRENLVKLMTQFQKYLPRDCLVIWVTTPPIATEMKGGFLVKELQFLKYSLRFHVVESNYYARKIVVSHGYDVLDFHYHLRMQLHRRAPDGVHWSPEAVRYLLDLLLTHISLAWGKSLPHRYNSVVVNRSLEDKNNLGTVKIEMTSHDTASDVAKTDEHSSSDRIKQEMVDKEEKPAAPVRIKQEMVDTEEKPAAPVRIKQEMADKEEKPAAPKRVKITAPSPSTPRKLHVQNTEKENASSSTNGRRKRGRIHGSCGAFMKKLQQEDRNKKKSYHQSNYVRNFVPDVNHVSIPLLSTPQVSLIQSSDYHSPYSSAIPSSSFSSPYSPSQPTPYTPVQLLSPYSPSQPRSLYSPTEFHSPYSTSQLILQSSPPELVLYSPSQLLPYSPSQPLKSYINHQYNHAHQFRKQALNNFMFDYQGNFKNDVANFSQAYSSFE